MQRRKQLQKELYILYKSDQKQLQEEQRLGKKHLKKLFEHMPLRIEEASISQIACQAQKI